MAVRGLVDEHGETVLPAYRRATSDVGGGEQVSPPPAVGHLQDDGLGGERGEAPGRVRPRSRAQAAAGTAETSASAPVSASASASAVHAATVTRSCWGAMSRTRRARAASSRRATMRRRAPARVSASAAPAAAPPEPTMTIVFPPTCISRSPSAGDEAGAVGVVLGAHRAVRGPETAACWRPPRRAPPDHVRRPGGPPGLCAGW